MRLAVAWVLLLGAVAHAEPRLRLDFELVPYTIHNDDPELVQAHVRSVALVEPGGKVRWRVPPPKVLSTFLTMKPAATAYLADPEASLQTLGLSPGSSLVRPREVVLYANEHLLVFAARDGKVLFNEVQGMEGFGALPFRRARATFSCGGETATRDVAMEPFLLGCRDRLVVYFVQGYGVFSTSPWKRLGGEMFPDVPPGQSPWTFTRAGATLTITRID